MCKPITGEEFQTTLQDILAKSVMLTEYVSNVITFQWVEGQCQIEEISRDNKRWGDGCPFCYITSMLRREACLPWVATMKFLGKHSIYKRTLSCLKSEGEDAMEWDTWAEDLCSNISIKSLD
jgi:hypothetical protein